MRQGTGLIAGMVVGALPFCLLGLAFKPAWYLTLGVAAVFGAAGYRAPGAWCAGVALGILGGWAFWSAVIGASWKMPVYVLLLFRRGYALAALTLGVTVLLAGRRPRQAV